MQPSADAMRRQCDPNAPQVFGRASKYSLFDPCKEMLFITMSDKRVSSVGRGAVG